jgi:predicted nucleic acid-binding protein
MVTHYADTSFLLSLYLPDVHSRRADAYALAHPTPFPLTEFHRLEFRNALSLAIFQKRLSSSDATAVWTDLETDINDGRLAPLAIDWASVFWEAEKLAAQHSQSLGTRSLDILHVSAAINIHARDFCTFDSRQADLATRAGLIVISAGVSS